MLRHTVHLNKRASNCRMIHSPCHQLQRQTTFRVAHLMTLLLFPHLRKVLFDPTRAYMLLMFIILIYWVTGSTGKIEHTPKK